LQVVIINDNEGKFYRYSNLGKLFIKKGDIVKKDQLIAFAELDDDEDDYTLWFMFSTKTKNVDLTKENFIAGTDTRDKDHSMYQ
jgi:hypothetical protein